MSSSISFEGIFKALEQISRAQPPAGTATESLASKSRRELKARDGTKTFPSNLFDDIWN
jgi:hypothetical protein